MAIEGKVAQVLNAQELIINVGRNGGVVEGMKFAVLAETPLAVKDPDSGALLGEVDREKVRVKATEVHEAFTVCRTYQIIRIPATRGFDVAAFNALSEAMVSRPAREVPVTLRVEDSALPPALGPNESYVKAKDRVKQVIESDS